MLQRLTNHIHIYPSCSNVRSVSTAAHDSNRHAQSTTLREERDDNVPGHSDADESIYRAQPDAFIGLVAVQAVPGEFQQLWPPAAVC